MSILGIYASSISGHLFPTSPVAGYNAWYDAADTATITVSGNAVTQWNDKSANAYNLTQGTSAERPSSGTRTINSKNVIDFDGSNDSLNAATASNWTFLSNSTGSSMFVVAISDGASNEGGLLVTSAGASANVGVEFIRRIDTSFRVFVSNGSAGNRSVSALAQGTWADATAVYYTLLLTPNNATTLDRAISRVDGGSELKSNTLSAAPSGSSPYSPLCVGNFEDGAAGGFNGGIGEIILYNSILNATDRELNESYLKNKWGL